MDAAELRQKPEAELTALLAELRDKLRSLRFERSASRLKNVREIPALRRDAAKILTILRAKLPRARR